MKKKKKMRDNGNMSMEDAIIEVLQIENESEKLCRLVDLARGFKSPFNIQTEKREDEGFSMCKDGLRSQRGKIKRLIREYYEKK